MHACLYSRSEKEADENSQIGAFIYLFSLYLSSQLDVYSVVDGECACAYGRARSSKSNKQLIKCIVHFGYMATSSLCLVLHFVGTNEYEIARRIRSFWWSVGRLCRSLCSRIRQLRANFDHNSLNSHSPFVSLHFFVDVCVSSLLHLLLGFHACLLFR